MRFHEDDRRTFWGDLFGTPNGDVNVVQLHPDVVIAWHRHQRQDDRLFLLQGDLLIQMIDSHGVREWWEIEGPSRIVTIPRNSWHGYATRNGATIVSFNGPSKWTGEDEERHPINEAMPWTPTR